MILSQLKKAMDENKVSVEHLADKTCMSASTIFKARKGNKINVNTAKRIASGLRMNIEQLI